MGKNFNIALLTNLLAGESNFEFNIWRGAIDCAKENGVNLICFAGGNISLNSEKKYANVRNNIYDLVTSKRIDGIILLSTSISSFISEEDYKNFIKKFKNIPVVSIGKAPLDIPCSLVDNKTGMKNVISHLIKVHNRKNLAFITGPLDNPDAKERFAAYRETLSENGLMFREEYVFNGLFIEESGRLAVKEFLDRKINFDAIIASNDLMAFGALSVLLENNIKVPEDVSVVGFDDEENAKFSNPPLTTVKQNFYKQSYLATKMLIDFLNGKSINSSIIETEIVIRQSCGCFSNDINIINNDFEISEELTNYNSKLNFIISKTEEISLEKDYKKIIIESILKDLEGTGVGFLEIFRKVLNEIITKNVNFDELSLFISKLHLILSNIYDSNKVGKLIHKARIIFSDSFLRKNIKSSFTLLKVNEVLRSNMFTISGNFELKEFLENFKISLDSLNIPGGYLLLKTGEKFSFLYGYRKEKGILRSEFQIIDKEDILPSDLWKDKDFNLNIFPLIYRNEFFGLLILEVGTLVSFVYESLFYQISSSLKGVMLFERNKRIEVELTEKNNKLEAISSSMINSIEEISNILKEKEKSLGQLQEVSKETYNELSRTNELLQHIANYANKINEIIAIIDDISMTVNLVALNASIESTHAGEYGKGFAIIAREIKKLSDSTKKNAEEIAVTLKTVIQNVNESLNAGKKTIDTFKYQEESILELLNALMTVAGLVKKLNTASKELTDIMK